MMMRAARYLDVRTGSAYAEAAGTVAPTFPDEAEISGWALPDVRLANQLDIMRGQGGNRINPLGNTTIQESILLVLRLYTGFSGATGTGSVPVATPTPVVTPTPAISPTPEATPSPTPVVTPTPIPGETSTPTPTPSPFIPIFTPIIKSVSLTGGTHQYDTLSVYLIQYTSIPSDNPTLAYQWSWSNAATGAYTEIPGATAAQFIPPTAYIGRYLRCTVTASGSVSGQAHSAPKGPITSGFAYGGGTAEDPYVITQPDHFMRLDVMPTLVRHFRLANSITLPDQARISATFAGTLDGNDDTVTCNITTTADETGLFSRATSAATLRNLNVSGTVTAEDKTGVGGIVGYNFGTLTNCTSGVRVTGGMYVGGIAGYNSGTVTDCESDDPVTGDTHVGGIAGYNAGTIQACTGDISISGSRFVGGVAGRTPTSSRVHTCFSPHMSSDCSTPTRIPQAGWLGKTCPARPSAIRTPSWT